MNKKEWLEARKKGIGGTDASAILGLNPWKTSVEVWESKVFGTEKPVSNIDAVRYGAKAERPLLALFKLDYPQYKVIHRENDIKINAEYPFLFGSLDGEIIEKETGRRGVLEVKTTEILNSMHREKWKEQLPGNYYIQVLHYLLVTGWEFAVVKAQLKSRFGNDLYLQTKHYFIERAEVLDDIEFLKEKCVEFWKKYIEPKKKPPLVLPAI